MEILEMNIKVDKLPNGCTVVNADDESCVFKQHKYCVLKIALHQKDTFVQNNRGIIPEDCPLRQ